jgi:hypothetical protein
MISAAAIEGKTVEELKAMLADDTLLPIDDDSSTDLILEITAAIVKKENKSAEQEEAERVAFWTGLLDRYGDKLPVRLEDVVPKHAGDPKAPALASPDAGYVRNPRPALLRKAGVAAAAVVALVVCNTLIALAFNFNVLRALISFTDEMFTKTIVSTGTPEPPAGIDGGAYNGVGDYESLQEALDANGITEPIAPAWLPDGYELERVEISVLPGRVMLVGVYAGHDDELMFAVTSFTVAPPEQSVFIEKSEGEPLIYERNGIEHYIFKNLDRTVATWLIGSSDCTVQGRISENEMLSIIDSMYMED